MLLDIYLGLRSAIEGRPVGPEFVPYSFPENECLKLHVIGTCGQCEFMKVKDLEKFPYQFCEKRKNYYKVDDGCIRWEAKERSK